MDRFGSGGRLVVHGLAGNDDIRVSGAVAAPLRLYGDEGDDRLRSGDGPDVLLVRGGGRDLLIGGRGADRLVGNAAADILIAGYTSFDAIDEALAAIMAEWISSQSYVERVKNLRGENQDRSADFDQRAKGEVFLAVDGTHGRVTTLFDHDAAAELASDLDFINGTG